MGRPKDTLLTASGTTLLETAQETLRTICEGMVWVSRPFGFRPLTPMDLPDSEPDRGPLEGLKQILSHLERDWAAVLAVDLPRVGAGWFEILYRSCQSHPDADLVCPADEDGRLQPLAALWHRRALPVVNAVMTDGGPARVLRVVEHLCHDTVPVPSRALFNVNTPDDWDHFRRETNL